MSEKKAGHRVIHVSAGVFPTLDAARKEADSLKAWIKRHFPPKGYTCRVVIGVSENNPHTGEISTAKTGKRGRPRKEFVRTNGTMQPTTTAPHIHIIIYAEPAETVAKEIAARLNAKYGKGKRVAWVKNCGGYVQTAARYILKQSIKIRTVSCENGDICCPPCTDIFSFTLSDVNTNEENGTTAGVSAIQTDCAGLLYKRTKEYNFPVPYSAHSSFPLNKNFSLAYTSLLCYPFSRRFFQFPQKYSKNLLYSDTLDHRIIIRLAKVSMLSYLICFKKMQGQEQFMVGTQNGYYRPQWREEHTRAGIKRRQNVMDSGGVFLV